MNKQKLSPMSFRLLLLVTFALIISACSNISELKSSNSVRVSVVGDPVPQVAEGVKSVDTGRLKIYVLDQENPYRKNLAQEVDMGFRVPVAGKAIRVAQAKPKYRAKAPVRRAAVKQSKHKKYQYNARKKARKPARTKPYPRKPKVKVSEIRAKQWRKPKAKTSKPKAAPKKRWRKPKAKISKPKAAPKKRWIKQKNARKRILAKKPRYSIKKNNHKKSPKRKWKWDSKGRIVRTSY